MLNLHKADGEGMSEEDRDKLTRLHKERDECLRPVKIRITSYDRMSPTVRQRDKHDDEEDIPIDALQTLEMLRIFKPQASILLSSQTYFLKSNIYISKPPHIANLQRVWMNVQVDGKEEVSSSSSSSDSEEEEKEREEGKNLKIEEDDDDDDDETEYNNLMILDDNEESDKIEGDNEDCQSRPSSRNSDSNNNNNNNNRQALRSSNGSNTGVLRCEEEEDKLTN